MIPSKQKYYLTMFGPGIGERVVASVETDDRYAAEKLFGCGTVSDKGFGFRGLYTEEEVLHMFKPGTNIAGTYNPSTGTCDKHLDYHKVSLFEVSKQKAYRCKALERWLLALDGKNIEFSYVKDVMAGKIKPLSVTSIGTVDESQSTVKKQDAKKSVMTEEKTVSFLDAMNAYENPVANDLLVMFDDEAKDPDFEDKELIGSKDLSDVYLSIQKERAKSKLAGDPDYISDFDASFHTAQRNASEADDFKKKIQQVSIGKSQTGEPLKKQGQSLHDLMHVFGRK